MLGTNTPREGIAAARAHAERLMELPGVVGVAEGLDDDSTPIIVVMVSSPTLLEPGSIPSEIDGFAVHIEETGELWAQGDDQRAPD